MENEGTKIGLVGFFDILGYQNLLERNEPEEIAGNVLPILTKIDGTVIKNLHGIYNSLFLEVKAMQSSSVKPDTLAAVDKKHKKIINAMRWLIFSDTVLLTLPIEDKDPIIVRTSWTMFILATVILQIKLFDAGLPTRGAIEYGKFFVKDMCFAGRTIVTAYQLCSQIELAACVFSEVAANEFIRLDMSNDLDSFVVEYLIPMKSGEKHLLTVMAHTYDIDSPDIHGEVMRAFWGNRKDISLSARQKAQNTEQWLDFIEYRRKMKEKQETKS